MIGNPITTAKASAQWYTNHLESDTRYGKRHYEAAGNNEDSLQLWSKTGFNDTRVRS